MVATNSDLGGVNESRKGTVRRPAEAFLNHETEFT